MPGAAVCTPQLTKVSIAAATSIRDIAALGPDYERLDRATANQLPFALHAWHLTWCEHFMNSDPRVQEEPLFYVLRKPDQSCVAILPFIVNRRRIGPLKVQSVALLGADPAITEIRTPLIESGFECLAARMARDALARNSDWDWIHWTGLNPPFAEALGGSASLKWQPPLVDLVLDLPPTWEEFRSRLKRNIRESLRHCYNSLKRDGHVFTFEVLTDPESIRVGLDRFLTLHRMRARLAHPIVHEDRFASRVSRSFLRAVCERLAARGVARLFALKIGSEFVAMRMGFVVGDALYLYYSGFDPGWWRYGVMTTTVAEAIKYAIASGLKIVNLSPVRDMAKTRWSPREVAYGSAYELQTRLRSRVMNGAYLKIKSEDDYPSKLLGRLTRRRWT